MTLILSRNVGDGIIGEYCLVKKEVQIADVLSKTVDDIHKVY